MRGNYKNVASLEDGACVLRACEIKKNGHLLRNDYHTYFEHDYPLG